MPGFFGQKFSSYLVCTWICRDLCESLWNKNSPSYDCWWVQPMWKIWSSNWMISPGFGVKKEKCLKPPPSYDCWQASLRFPETVSTKHLLQKTQKTTGTSKYRTQKNLPIVWKLNGKKNRANEKKHRFIALVVSDKYLITFNWAVLSDEQMSNGYPFSLLNDEQMSNKVGVKHQPVKIAAFIFCFAALPGVSHIMYLHTVFALRSTTDTRKKPPS